MMTRTCTICSQAKDLQTEFHTNGVTPRTGRIKRMYQCKDCSNEQRRQRGLKKGWDRSDTQRKEMRIWVNSLKDGGNCVDCGISFKGRPWLADYHHKDPSTKISSIASAVTFRWTKEAILEEINKCELLCPNCHRTRHFNEKGHNSVEKKELLNSLAIY